MPDLMAVLLAASASFVAMGIFVAAILVFNPSSQFSRAVLLLDGLLTFLAVGGVRMSVPVVGESRHCEPDQPDSANSSQKHPGMLTN